jgi:hypothetical protein
MKRKVVNPNPQEKIMHKLEEKIYETDMKEQIIRSEEMIDDENIKNNKKNKIK